MAEKAINDDKPKWWSFFAWPLIGAGFTFSVLEAVTIGLFVFPFVLVALFAMLKWGGHRRSSVGIISGAGLPFLVLGYLNRSGPGTVCRPFENGGQQCTQEYSPWPFLMVGVFLIVLGLLVFLRVRSSSGVSSNLKGLLVLILVTFAMTFRLIVYPSIGSQMSTESGRVQYSFNGILAALAKNGDVPASTLPPVRVDVASYPDGSKASLWIPNFAMKTQRSGCFALDVVQDKSGSAGFFESSCAVPKGEVILERQNSVVVGFVGLTKAHEVSVEVGDKTLVVPMLFGYFLVPGSISSDPATKYTITYTEPGQATCEVSDLPAPGVSDLFHCVIA